MSINHITARVDGSSLGNPGPAGIGVLIEADGHVLKRISKPLGETTNNAAEYEALLEGLREAAALGADRVTICSDSKLVVNQINSEWTVKSPYLLPLHRAAQQLLDGFKAWEIRHETENYIRPAHVLAQSAAHEARIKTK